MTVKAPMVTDGSPMDHRWMAEGLLSLLLSLFFSTRPARATIPRWHINARAETNTVFSSINGYWSTVQKGRRPPKVPFSCLLVYRVHSNYGDRQKPDSLSNPIKLVAVLACWWSKWSWFHYKSDHKSGILRKMALFNYNRSPMNQRELKEKWAHTKKGTFDDQMILISL